MRLTIPASFAGLRLDQALAKLLPEESRTRLARLIEEGRVRVDGAIYTGYEIPPHYDSLCAKLIVWALTWDELLDRANRALRDISVYGVKTTIPYHLEIINSPQFQTGHFDTSFVESHPELINYSAHRPARELAAAIAASIAAHMRL